MATVESGDFIITSNHESEAAMRAALVESPDAEQSRSDAAVGEGSGDAGDHPDGEGTETGTGQTLRADNGSGTKGSSGSPQESVGKKAKPRDNMQARLSQETQRRHQLEQQLAEREAELSRLRQPAPKQADAAKPAQTFSFPNYEQWIAANPGAASASDAYDQWQDAKQDARTDWKLKSGQFVSQADLEQHIQARLTEERAKSENATALEAFQARTEQGKQKYRDYQAQVDAADATMQAEGWGITPAMADAIFRSDSSHDLVYYLATHPEDARQLASSTVGLDVTAAPLIRQLLESRLGAGAPHGSVPATELSRAKPPIRPLGASSVTVPDEPGDDESFDSYFSRMNAADRKRGRL